MGVRESKQSEGGGESFGSPVARFQQIILVGHSFSQSGPEFIKNDEGRLGQAWSTSLQLIQQGVNICEGRWRHRKQGVGKRREEGEKIGFEVWLLGRLCQEVRVEKQFKQAEAWSPVTRAQCGRVEQPEKKL